MIYYPSFQIAMAQQVRERLAKVFMAKTGKSAEDVDDFIEELKMENRYVEEIYGSE